MKVKSKGTKESPKGSRPLGRHEGATNENGSSAYLEATKAPEQAWPPKQSPPDLHSDNYITTQRAASYFPDEDPDTIRKAKGEKNNIPFVRTPWGPILVSENAVREYPGIGLAQLLTELGIDRPALERLLERTKVSGTRQQRYSPNQLEKLKAALFDQEQRERGKNPELATLQDVRATALRSYHEKAWRPRDLPAEYFKSATMPPFVPPVGVFSVRVTSYVKQDRRLPVRTEGCGTGPKTPILVFVSEHYINENGTVVRVPRSKEVVRCTVAARRLMEERARRKSEKYRQAEQEWEEMWLRNRIR